MGKTSLSQVESIDEILARDAPADEPEYISLATEKRNPEMFAPLIGGTTPEEKAKIEQEILAMKELSYARSVSSRVPQDEKRGPWQLQQAVVL